LFRPTPRRNLRTTRHRPRTSMSSYPRDDVHLLAAASAGTRPGILPLLLQRRLTKAVASLFLGTCLCSSAISSQSVGAGIPIIGTLLAGCEHADYGSEYHVRFSRPCILVSAAPGEATSPEREAGRPSSTLLRLDGGCCPSAMVTKSDDRVAICLVDSKRCASTSISLATVCCFYGYDGDGVHRVRSRTAVLLYEPGISCIIAHSIS